MKALSLNRFKKVGQKKEGDNTKALSKSIQQETEKLHVLENDLDDLMRRITTANKQADLFSKLDLLKDAVSVKSDVLRKNFSLNQDSFEKVTGKKLADSEEAALDDILVNLSTKEKDQTDSSKALVSKLDKLKANNESDGVALKKIEDNLSSHTANILKVIEKNEIDQFEELVQEAEEDYNTATYNLNTFDVTKSFKVKAIEIAKQSKCCTLCNRGFSNSELDTFILEVQQNLNNVTAKKLQEDVDSTKKDVDQMKAINYDVLQYRFLTKEVSNYKLLIQKRVEEIQQLQKEYDILENSLEETKNSLNEANRLKQPLSNIARLRDEINHSQKQIEDVQLELDASGASSMSMNELQKLQQEKNFELKRLRQSIADATVERDSLQKSFLELKGRSRTRSF